MTFQASFDYEKVSPHAQAYSYNHYIRVILSK